MQDRTESARRTVGRERENNASQPCAPAIPRSVTSRGSNTPKVVLCVMVAAIPVSSVEFSLRRKHVLGRILKPVTHSEAHPVPGPAFLARANAGPAAACAAWTRNRIPGTRHVVAPGAGAAAGPTQPGRDHGPVRPRHELQQELRPMSIADHGKAIPDPSWCASRAVRTRSRVGKQ
jgi:hypothetical protein